MAPNLELQKRRPILTPELAKKLDEYKGKWVAVDETKMAIVGSGGSAAEAMKAAAMSNVTDPLVFRVPLHVRRLRIR